MVKNLSAALSVNQSCYFCFTDPATEQDVQHKHEAKKGVFPAPRSRHQNNTTLVMWWVGSSQTNYPLCEPPPSFVGYPACGSVREELETRTVVAWDDSWEVKVSHRLTTFRGSFCWRTEEQCTVSSQLNLWLHHKWNGFWWFPSSPQWRLVLPLKIGRFSFPRKEANPSFAKCATCNCMVKTILQDTCWNGPAWDYIIPGASSSQPTGDLGRGKKTLSLPAEEVWTLVTTYRFTGPQKRRARGPQWVKLLLILDMYEATTA